MREPCLKAVTRVKVCANQVHNCHCTGCDSHFKTNEHVEKSPTLCGEFCDDEPNCRFSLFNSATTKCYLYDQSQVSQIKIVPTGATSERVLLMLPMHPSLKSMADEVLHLQNARQNDVYGICRLQHLHLLYEVPSPPWCSRSSTILVLHLGHLLQQGKRHDGNFLKACLLRNLRNERAFYLFGEDVQRKYIVVPFMVFFECAPVYLSLQQPALSNPLCPTPLSVASPALLF